MSYLLDTNIVSELRKRAANSAVTAWFNAAPSADLFISALTIGEIGLGVERFRPKDGPQALVRGWTLVTRNTGDFARCGVHLLNPWKDTPAR